MKESWIKVSNRAGGSCVVLHHQTQACVLSGGLSAIVAMLHDLLFFNGCLLLSQRRCFLLETTGTARVGNPKSPAGRGGLHPPARPQPAEISAS